MRIFTVVFLGIIASCVRQGSSDEDGKVVQCYTCSCVIGSGDTCELLNEDFTYIPLITCAKGEGCGKYHKNASGKEVIFRSCVSEDFCESNPENTSHCNICMQDYCNSVSGLIPTMTLFIGALVTWKLC